MSQNGCVLCEEQILEDILNPNLLIELTGRKALPNYREGYLLIAFKDGSTSKLKFGICSKCKESVDSNPSRFVAQIMEGIKAGWVCEMQELRYSIEKAVKYAQFMFSITPYGYFNGKA